MPVPTPKTDEKEVVIIPSGVIGDIRKKFEQIDHILLSVIAVWHRRRCSVNTVIHICSSNLKFWFSFQGKTAITAKFCRLQANNFNFFFFSLRLFFFKRGVRINPVTPWGDLTVTTTGKQAGKTCNPSNILIHSNTHRNNIAEAVPKNSEPSNF